jgi:hypothetical protein
MWRPRRTFCRFFAAPHQGSSAALRRCRRSTRRSIHRKCHSPGSWPALMSQRWESRSQALPFPDSAVPHVVGRGPRHRRMRANPTPRKTGRRQWRWSALSNNTVVIPAPTAASANATSTASSNTNVPAINRLKKLESMTVVIRLRRRIIAKATITRNASKTVSTTVVMAAHSRSLMG